MNLELSEPPERLRITKSDLFFCFALLLATFAAYSSVGGFSFVDLDDAGYVYGNRHLAGGFSFANIEWALFSVYPDFWFPVTNLSFILDYRLFGLWAGGYHIVNVLIHALSSVLLFGFLRRATQLRWPSAFVALIFALHPLHVESVAWISERKDVLSAFFWFATLWVWTAYTQRRSALRYAAALALFAMGLMSKTMLMTLPLQLLLLDVWPFRRAVSWKLVTEKIPFFFLSAGAMVISVKAAGGAIKPLGLLPIGLRIENVFTSLAYYIGDTLWPDRLWALYSFPSSIPLAAALAAAAGIGAVSYFAWRQRSERPYLTVGWFWFLLTLLPVIGIIQAGDQSRADRYMYVPIVGLAIIASWGALEIARQQPELRNWIAGLALVLSLAMGVRTWFQTQYWEDTLSLYDRATEMDPRNYLAWSDKAHFRAASGALAEAIAGYRIALDINPAYVPSRNLLGVALFQSRRPDEAITEYREVIRERPDYAPAHYNLGAALLATGKKADAIKEFEATLSLNPEFMPAHNDLGVELWKTPGRAAEGISHMEEAVRIDPDYYNGQYNLGMALLSQPGKLPEAVAHFREALRLDPNSVGAHLGLGSALMRDPSTRAEGVAHLRTAQDIDPDPQRARMIQQLILNPTVIEPAAASTVQR